MAHVIILRLDVAEDFRPLLLEECELRKILKMRVISLVVLERSVKNNVPS
jgi:hypothetical protein